MVFICLMWDCCYSRNKISLFFIIREIFFFLFFVFNIWILWKCFYTTYVIFTFFFPICEWEFSLVSHCCGHRSKFEPCKSLIIFFCVCLCPFYFLLSSYFLYFYYLFVRSSSNSIIVLIINVVWDASESHISYNKLLKLVLKPNSIPMDLELFYLKNLLICSWIRVLERKI